MHVYMFVYSVNCVLVFMSFLFVSNILSHRFIFECINYDETNSEVR